MALTRSFRDTVAARAQHDAAFRAALLEEVFQALLEGDMPTARALLRDCINATIGFARLSEATHKPAKSLMRMVGPHGNPSADTLIAVLRAVQQSAGLHAHIEITANHFTPPKTA